MSEVLNRIARLILPVCFLISVTAQGQILRDTSSMEMIRKSVDEIYNLSFEDAREITDEINLRFPGHPVVYLLKGMIIYWESYPLTPASPENYSFQRDMLTCIELCDRNHDPADYPEYLLANLGARGLLLTFYADNGLSRDVIRFARNTYRFVRQSFNYRGVYPDFYFFTGLYNYYREMYPELHPVYRAFSFLFPKGDRYGGLEEIRMAADSSIMLKAEAYFFLSYIYLNYEKDYQQARFYSLQLHNLYPENTSYLGMYIEILLLTKKYDEADGLIRESLEKPGNEYFKGKLAIFSGLLQEKRYLNISGARKLYNKGLEEISSFGAFGNESAAIAYFGLSRINSFEGNVHQMRVYRKMAMELSDSRRDIFAY